MNKVLIWDHTGDSPKWCEKYLEKNDVEIVHTITSADPVPELLLKKDAWDWLLIFEKNMRATFDTTVRALKLPLEKVIYALDGKGWDKHLKAAYALLNTSGGGIARKRAFFNELKKSNTFFTCTVEGLSYIGTSVDPLRMPRMFSTGTNWATGTMKRFLELSKQYYDVDDSEGYFFDLGANIGTTGLYFTKKLAPNLKLLAFEPDPENYKMHRINVILNDMEEITSLVNCGLSNEESELTFYNSRNPGARSFISHGEREPIATIKVIPLDAYLAENNIDAQSVKYIWIDVEGFESRVLLGAKNLLRENPAPIFMECNLKAWDESGLFEEMMALLAENYSHFIHFWKGETLYPLDALRTLERPNNTLGQCGDIFLIRKGAIV